MLYGFGLSGYRSFGPETQLIAPLTRINIFVGQNNVGKSNVLRALHGLSILTRNPKDAAALEAGSDHRGQRDAPYAASLPVPLSGDLLEGYLDRLSTKLETDRQAKDAATAILKVIEHHATNAAWYSVRPPKDAPLSPTPNVFTQERDASGRVKVGGIDSHDWAHLWNVLTGQQRGDLNQHHIPETLLALSPFGRMPMPEIHRIEPHRQIGDATSDLVGLNGAGLIRKLKALQHPGYKSRSADLEKFAKINEFLRVVTGVSHARLEITDAESELLVDIDGKVLPISDLGTGIHEVVIFAAAATAFDNAIMCLEEPEIHLHPRLQRRLLAYLRDNTTNQYFITTHSAHLLDCADASIFHVQLNEYKETTVTLIESPSSRASVCFDLGYRPSDMVQANCIVWVEGPSDRIYVNAWLASVDSKLREGEHYSVMFYGGRLLAHLTVSDQDITDFIELQRLNRRVAILIDSDRGNSKEDLRATKLRVIDETVKQGGFAWVTAGREIENYIAESRRAQILKEVHPKTNFKPNRGTWLCMYETSTGDRSLADKLQIARAAAADIDLSVLDLREQVTSLVRFIHESNNRA